MDGKSLKDEDEKIWSKEEKSMMVKHLNERQLGEDNPLQEPLKFNKRALDTLNPTERDLMPEEMIGRTFLMPPTADGSRYRAKIMSKVQAMKEDAQSQPEFIKFKCIVNNDVEDVIAYNDIVDYIEMTQTRVFLCASRIGSSRG